MKIWIEAELLRLGGLRAQALRSKGVPGPEGSVLKLLQGRLSQDISEFIVDVMGADSMLCTKYTSARGEPLAAPDPVIAFVGSPGGHHRRRQQRHPAQHHRRSRLRPATGAPASTRTRRGARSRAAER